MSEIYFIISSRCNLHCSFCIRKNISMYEDITIEDAKSVIDKLAIEFSRSNMIITGGEPTLHDNFLEIVEYACKRFLRVYVNSNGMFSLDIANGLKKFLKTNLYIQFSLDGRENVHDILRGPGSFNHTLFIINRLRTYASHIFISTTVGNSNIKDVLMLPKILQNMKFKCWKVSQEQVEYPTLQNVMDSSSWNSFVDTLLTKCCFRVSIKKMFDFKLFDKFMDEKINFQECIRNCGLGNYKMYITPTQDVLGCSCMPSVYGNLKQDTVEKVKLRLKGIKVQVPENSPCFKCKYKVLCNSGCPGYSYKVFGKCGMGDLRCPIIKNKLIDNEEKNSIL